MKNSIVAIWILSLVTFISSVAMIFDLNYFNEKQIDVYLYFDHSQFPAYIAEDVATRINYVLLSYGFVVLIPYRNLKRIAWCFFWVSVAAIPYYFLLYSQFASVVLLPALIISLILTSWYNYEQRSHVR